MFRRIALALALASPLAGCATLPASPAQTANHTKLDEKLGIGATVAYITASKLGTALARAGIINATKFKALDAEAYKAIQEVRAAYEAGNADSYAAAIAKVQALVEQVQNMVETDRVS